MQAVYRQLGREDATLLAEVAGVSSCRYLRDAHGVVTNEVQNGVAVPRALDAYGRPASAGDAAYGYDAAGRLASVSSGGLDVGFAYLPGTDLPAGWSCGGFRRTVTYGEFRDLVAAVTNAFGGSPVSSVAYGYDAAGRRTSVRRDPPGSPDAYGYDALSRLVSVDRTDGPGESFAYDGAGNRTASSLGGEGTAYAANALNQIVRVSSGGGAFGPRYDADGNPTRIRTATGDWTVEWDAESRPVRWTCGDRTLLMAYDHLGRRVRLVETAGGATNRVATFVYDGYGCIARTAGGTTDRFVRDPSTGRPLAMVADGRAYLYAHDANGNVAALVDAETGVVAARYAYAAFGATLTSEGPLARRNPFRFSSECADDETGLVYYNWRHYDPARGVWLGRDPIGPDGGANLYAFCGNRPLDRVDYLGMDAGDLCSPTVQEDDIIFIPPSGRPRIVRYPMNVRGKTFTAGRVTTSDFNVERCCACIPSNPPSRKYRLVLKIKMELRMTVVDSEIVKGHSRKGVRLNTDKIVDHEQLHVSNLRKLFDRKVSELKRIAARAQEVPRETCKRVWDEFKTVRIKEEWTVLTTQETLHEGVEWKVMKDAWKGELYEVP